MKNTVIPAAFSVNDAAARLGIGRVKLYELIDAQEIRSFKIGSRRLIPAAEIDAFINKRVAADMGLAA